MELYIGGFAQGKLNCVLKDNSDAIVIDENNFDEICDFDNTVIWNHFHLSVKKLLNEGVTSKDILQRVNELSNKVSKLIIISDEIGNGIVPIDAFERMYREETGRLLIEIAAAAEKVVRISCGIAQTIK